jgi:hypothetical protein
MGFQKPNPMSECKESKVFDASFARIKSVWCILARIKSVSTCAYLSYVSNPQFFCLIWFAQSSLSPFHLCGVGQRGGGPLYIFT